MRMVQVKDLGSKVGYLTTVLSFNNDKAFPEMARVLGLIKDAGGNKGSIRFRYKILSGPRAGRVFSSGAFEEQRVAIWHRRCPEFDRYFRKMKRSFTKAAKKGK